MIRTGLCLWLLLGMIDSALAGSRWERVGALDGLRCGNYCDIVEHRGRLYAADSNNGRMATGDFWISSTGSLDEAFSHPRRAIAREALTGFQDHRGQTADYARTIAIASDGRKLHALLHVGATYGSPKGYDYVPAYAVSTDNGRSWRYHGQVTIEGVTARPIFSSSMAYIIHEGTHYMVQDGGAYGMGGLVAFTSSNGRDWSRLGGDITAIDGDRPVFPDLVFHDGRFHLVYENGWGRGGDRVRHLSSADMRDWRLESDMISPSNYKGVNIFSYQGALYGHVGGGLWRARDDAGGSGTGGASPTRPEKPEPAGDGLAPKAKVQGGDVTITWNARPGTRYALKLVGPRRDFRKLEGDSFTYRDLPPGKYKVRVKVKGGRYSDTRFKIRPAKRIP